jgi:hypothetical protein
MPAKSSGWWMVILRASVPPSMLFSLRPPRDGLGPVRQLLQS